MKTVFAWLVTPAGMVQNQVTILGWNGPNGAFRQARPLAEGQKSADVKHDFHNTTPSANPDSWRRGPNFPRDMQIFRLSRHHLAEGVEFPEKNAGSGVFKSSFGGGDPPVGSATRLVAILNHARQLNHGQGLTHWSESF